MKNFYSLFVHLIPLISCKREETVKQTKIIQTVTGKNARQNEHPKTDQNKLIKFNLEWL
jgi:hypothetical protein